MLTVIPVVSRAELREFIGLPQAIYGDIPSYRPPLDLDSRMLLDPRKSAFWKRGQACYWLARIDGKPVGRISAQIDTRQPVGIPEGAGMFGCIDAINNEDVIAALIREAGTWLRDRGCRTLFGPCTLDMNDQPGLMIEGADEQQMFLCPWHPPYLQARLEALGLTKLHDLHNWRLDLAGASLERFDKMKRMAARVPGLAVRPPTRRTFKRDLAILCNIYNDGWKDNWGFLPLAPEDLSGLEQFMFWFLNRLVFRIVERNCEPVGVMLLLPNVYEIIGDLSPAPGLLGWAKLAWRAVTHRMRSGRIILLGIAAGLRHTPVGSAVAVLLVDEIVQTQARENGEWVEAGWVLEDNTALIQILERFEFHRNKTYRIYEHTLHS